MSMIFSSIKVRRRFFAFLGIFILLCFGIISAAISTKNYDLTVGSVCPETIYATRDITDQITTNELIDQAKSEVQTIYALDSTVAGKSSADIEEFFKSIIAAKNYVASRANADNVSFSHYKSKLSQEEKNEMLALIPIEISTSTLLSAISLDEAEIYSAMNITTQLVTNALAPGIKEENLNAAMLAISSSIESNSSLTKTARTLAATAVDAYMDANMLVDTAATDAALKAAEASVSPYIYKKGQAIARAGDILSEKQIALISALGLMKGSFVIWPYVAVLIILLLCAGAYLLFGALFEKRLLNADKNNIVVALVILITLIISAFLCKQEMRVLSIALVSICVTQTYSARGGAATGSIVALLVATMAYCAGVDATTVFAYLIGNIFAAIICSLVTERTRSRSGMVLAASIGGCAIALVYLIIALADAKPFAEIMSAVGYSLGGTILAGILCLGSMPVWETFFGVVTPVKLMELCNPSAPLMKRLTIEAPGTYHHSVMVANLAEAAAAAIGADVYVAWAGAYYHDVGKLAAPMYFSENQLPGVNPHESLTPEESCAIIARHTHDGVKILSEYKMPKVFADIAISHHGTGVMLYFANKEKERTGSEVNLNKFRHTGRKPNTIEEGIVMLADSVEAAVRSNPDNIEKTIAKVIRTKLTEGQLGDVPMTLNDLQIVGDAFADVLRGAYHKRIEYPDVKAEDFTSDEESNMIW